MSAQRDPTTRRQWTACLPLLALTFLLAPAPLPQHTSPHAPLPGGPSTSPIAARDRTAHRHDPSGGWVASGAFWDLRDSVFSVQGLFPTAKAYYAATTFTDFEYEVRIAKLAEDGATGLLFRYDNIRDEGYEIHIWPHGGFAIAKVRGPNKTDFASGPPSHFKKELNTWNSVRIIARGDRFNFFVNSFHVCTAIDGQYARGKLGLLMPGDARQRARFHIVTMHEITGR